MTRIIYFIIVISISLPFVFQITEGRIAKPLKGYFQTTQKPTFSLNDWLNGNWQEQTDNFTKDHFGTREFFIRINNQKNYALYNIVNTQSVIVGNNNCIYEENYIKAYYGKDFIGNEKIKSISTQIKSIDDFLKKNNTHLCIILAPGKGSYYPEFIPLNYQTGIDSTNYEIFKKNFDDMNIPYIDFKAYFLANKLHSKYPLYSLSGVHWSDYGASLVADSLVKYVQSFYTEELPNFSYEIVDVTTHLSETDMDAEASLNLLFSINQQEMAYTKNSFSTEGKRKLKSIVIADSYYWQLFNFGFSSQFFDNGKFWYYYQQVFPDNFEKETLVQDVDAINELKNNDFVFIISTDANLFKFPFGFENLISNSDQDRDINEETINGMIEYIKSDSTWYASICKKAENNNVPVDSMLRIDAIWKLEQDQNTTKNQNELQTIIENIKQDTTWYNNIKQKAIKNNISVDKQLELDAHWLLDSKK
ncbi:MAG: hypothetical protein JXR60_06805 [Bacteroidales bacterium]|nr:hypothetical protein [Bacteroidales bacterium]